MEHTRSKGEHAWDFLYVDTQEGQLDGHRSGKGRAGGAATAGSRSPPPEAAKGKRGKNSTSKGMQSSRAGDNDGGDVVGVEDSKKASDGTGPGLGTTRIIDDEFLVQSLILGKLLPE